MTTLIANGCSHTAGTHLEYFRQKICYTGTWPRWLADDMGWNWINLARPGNSNEQIKRTTIEWIIENVELTNRYKSEELVVMIMWSGFDRFEVWNEKMNELISCQANFVWSDESKRSPELVEYIKYRVLISDPAVNEYKNLMDVYLTAKYLESLNIKYYFMNSIYHWRDPRNYNLENLKQNYRQLINIYGDRKDKHLGFYSPEKKFTQVMIDNNMIPSEHDPTKKHYGVDGQKFWAKYIKDWMTTIDNI